MTKKAEKTEVAKVEEPSTEMLPGGGYDYGDHGGVGYETTTANDILIPFMNLLQTNSDVIAEGKIEGAKPGQWLNTVTGELVDSFVILPVHEEESWAEWWPRTVTPPDGQNKLVGHHDPNSDIVQGVIKANNDSRIPPKGADGKRIAFTNPENDNRTELIETHYVYNLLLDDTGEEMLGFAIIANTSTKITPYKKWMTSRFQLRGRPPIYANRAVVGSEFQKNDSGQPYHTATYSPLKGVAEGEPLSWRGSLIPPTHPLFKEAISFREMVLNGMAKADFANAEQGEGPSAQGRGSGAPVPGEDDEAPF